MKKSSASVNRIILLSQIYTPADMMVIEKLSHLSAIYCAAYNIDASLFNIITCILTLDSHLFTLNFVMFL